METEKDSGVQITLSVDSEKKSQALSNPPSPEVTIRSRDSAINPADGDKPRLRKSVSMDATPTEGEGIKKPLFSSFKRRSVRRRSSKRFERPEPTYGNNTAAYEAIRDRVLEERAVVNAIEALQERWRMLMFMYEDCVELNEGRIDRRLSKLCIKRQYELIVIITLFVFMCIPTSVSILILLCKLT